MKAMVRRGSDVISTRGMVLAALALLAVLVFPEAGIAQAEALGQQRLGRAYWHVFLSYAIGWVLIMGWVVSIARRLSRVEKGLDAPQR